MAAKIGIGPASAHIFGPMDAADPFLNGLEAAHQFDVMNRVRVTLYGSLGEAGRDLSAGL
jgi:L-serine dehydratase